MITISQWIKYYYRTKDDGNPVNYGDDDGNPANYYNKLL